MHTGIVIYLRILLYIVQYIFYIHIHACACVDHTLMYKPYLYIGLLCSTMFPGTAPACCASTLADAADMVKECNVRTQHTLRHKSAFECIPIPFHILFDCYSIYLLPFSVYCFNLYLEIVQLMALYFAFYCAFYSCFAQRTALPADTDASTRPKF